MSAGLWRRKNHHGQQRRHQNRQSGNDHSCEANIIWSQLLTLSVSGLPTWGVQNNSSCLMCGFVWGVEFWGQGRSQFAVTPATAWTAALEMNRPQDALLWELGHLSVWPGSDCSSHVTITTCFQWWRYDRCWDAYVLRAPDHLVFECFWTTLFFYPDIIWVSISSVEHLHQND